MSYSIFARSDSYDSFDCWNQHIYEWYVSLGIAPHKWYSVCKYHVSKAGIAVGVDGLFMETHEDPSVAKSDGANMLKLDLLEGLLTKLVRIRQVL